MSTFAPASAPSLEDVERVVRDPVRLAALRSLGLLDSPPEEAFDRHAPQFATSRGLGFNPTANFLQKPFTVTDLVSAVRTALDATHVPEGA